MLIPLRAEIIQPRVPYTNFVLIGLCVLFFVLMLTSLPDSVIEMMILEQWKPVGLIGHMFLHADPFHLIGNMIYLWLFGNAICSKLGNIKYIGLYLLLGLSAAIMHNIFDGHPAVGASGAINGLIGFFLMLYPINQIYCFYGFMFKFGTFHVSSFWIIGLWLALDLWGALSGSADGIAYWAHLGGFFGGMGLGAVFLKMNWIETDESDNRTLLDYMTGSNKDAADQVLANRNLRQTNSPAPKAISASTPQPDETGVYRYVEWYDAENNLLGREYLKGLSVGHLRYLWGAQQDDGMHDYYSISQDQAARLQRYIKHSIQLDNAYYYIAAYEGPA